KSKLPAITYSLIEAYKAHRFRTPTRHGRTRGVPCVNRELQTLRRMLNIAVKEGWIQKAPFGKGAALINHADEKHRERVISFAEEERLLAACIGRRAHLRPLLICGFDTAMRTGEMLKMTWRDVDLENRLVKIPSFNTKTMRERQVAMTERLHDELFQ